MDSKEKYGEAVKIIKTAILQSQYEAAKGVNEKQLTLYYAIGKYISMNSRAGFWGKGAIAAISDQLNRELPGLRGFTTRNLRYMRSFYEEWEMLDSAKANEHSVVLKQSSAKIELALSEPIGNLQLPNYGDFPLESFLHIGFTHHREILKRTKDLEERVFYIKKCADEHLSVEDLKKSLSADEFNHQGKLPNNFAKTLPVAKQAIRAIGAFKDEYLLDYINVEELESREGEVDERVVEKAFIHNVRKFILAFGKDFAFIRNQYRLEAFGEEQFIDLLFFNRELNCLVAVELKMGKFKAAYLGQLQSYLSILDGFERKPHENPAIGIILCKDMNRSYVDYVIQDYVKPMGVATYRTSKDMPEELRKALPDVEDLRKLLDEG